MDTSVSKKPASTSTMEFLSFSLGGLEYGLEFNKVQELRMLKSLERVASGGEVLNGVAVSRGVIMPIVDMRAAMEGVPAPPDPATDVIILELNNCVMGMVVDGVTGVVQLRQDQISPMPGASHNADYLMGLGEAEGRRLVLVDIDKLMAIKRRSAGPRQHTA
ncbi:chemotaxis protein CheW [Pseudoduganella sp. GCM10020061]|uniref:chemotaxis protein CheW n=1 Tax=Pseudoduganella sp. GCM10020061 TaxID=3317345 RepID=UPI00362BBB23